VYERSPVETPPAISPASEQGADHSVPNRPPVIVGREPPGARVALTEGEAARFEVRGDDPDGGDPPPGTWSLDGERVGEGARWQLTAPSPRDASERHVVDAELRDDHGATVRAHWDVEVAGVAPRVVRGEPTSPHVRFATGESHVLRVDAASAS